ncbi:MAG: hypothetical protein EA424_18240 [Planctomycetaceae bacterium]|nr:MAG: hypothetical protein EA424_18240 [Planctomycetaceae bacterium]
MSVSGDSLIATAYPHRFETKPAIGSLVTPRASSAGRAHIRYSMPGQDRLWHWNDTSSEFLLAMDRHTDEIRWVRQARYGFRHNADGTVLWHRQDEFSRGPLALHAAQRRILPVSLDIVTGEPVERENPVTGELEPWSFAINKSCGTRNVSRHLMTFRSSMASYHDLQHESGTTDLSGVRAGCTNNMITADGVLNVPDYTRSCSCAYQLQTSFGLVPMPDIEIRTISTYADPEPGSIRRVGINFGAPGTRIADGLMWINYPRRQHVAAPRVVVQVETVDERLDIVRAADGPQRAYVAEFRGVATEPGRPLVIEFPARDGSIHPPLLCGVETRLEE